jgi:hypothetical protein
MNTATAQDIISRKEYLTQLKHYKNTLQYTLATTRFTNATWNENSKFREKNPNAKCAYLLPIPISRNIPMDSAVFVLEMNNDKNQIMGIGMIKNHAIYGKYEIYENRNYNRFSYIGKWRIDVSEMNSEEREILKLFEAMCFKGANHSKRGQGITAFPLKLMYKCSPHVDLTNYIKRMFKKRMDQKNI